MNFSALLISSWFDSNHVRFQVLYVRLLCRIAIIFKVLLCDNQPRSFVDNWPNIGLSRSRFSKD